ncbi:hypothetical protein GN244_ATG05634 [Phytophthora infestans]|uniref:Uncharacterized protein n=1 Tax=Phytophthora infestans TaxID=4787 RepID=A0A833T4K7_PHYIN|nr:hypothetical protein GN244_ATG05634 [Phytophthora infestans]
MDPPFRSNKNLFCGTQQSSTSPVTLNLLLLWDPCINDACTRFAQQETYPDASTVSAELRQQTPRVSHGRKAGQAAHAADAFSPKLSETISALDLVS